MRPNIVRTATGLAVVMAWWAVAAAQNNVIGRPQPASGSWNEATSAAPAALPGVKNYYAELFGEQPDQPQSQGGWTSSRLRMTSGADQSGARADQARFESPEPPRPAVTAQVPARLSVEEHSDSQDQNPFIPTPRGATANDPVPAIPTPAPAQEAPPDQEIPPAQTVPPAERQPMPPDGGMPPGSPSGSQRPSFDLSTSQAADDQLAGTYVPGPAALSVAWERRGEITVGRQHVCELVVANRGAGPATQVTLETHLPPSMKLIGADPRPSSTGGPPTWTIPALAPGTQQRIALTVMPTRQGDHQISAVVKHAETAAATLAVREPNLQVALSGPQEVPLGETVAQEVTVSNPGSGTTDNVSVEIKLPPGLEHAKGKSFVMPIGSLAAGQSRVIRVALYATSGGKKTIQVRATGGPELVSEASTSVLVAAPTLSLASKGPSLRFVGREAAYQIQVTNNGGAAANNVRIVHAIPSGFRFVRADKGGTYEPATGGVTWYVGRLEPGQTAQFSSRLEAASLGNFNHRIVANCEGGAAAESSIQTTIDGTASLAMEVVDLEDPIEVGAQTAYEIRVRNEGTRPAVNVSVACGVPQGVSAISARGPTAHQGNSSGLSFAPIPKLSPGKTALFRIVVKGTEPGKHRFRVRMTSGSIEEPLVHEELTYFYAD